MAHGIDNNDGGVGRGQGIDDASEGSEITTKAMRIRGRRQRLRRLGDGPEELATMKEASAEKDKPNYSTTKKEASEEEAEETTRLI